MIIPTSKSVTNSQLESLMSYIDWNDEELQEHLYRHIGYNVIQGNLFSGLCRHVATTQSPTEALKLAKRLEIIRISSNNQL